MIATRKKIALLMVVAIMAAAGMVMTTNLTGAHASEADGEPVSYTPGRMRGQSLLPSNGGDQLE